MLLLEAHAADGLAVWVAEELHELVVTLADPLEQVAHRQAQLVEGEHGVHLMRLQVLLTEGGHAGQAGPGRFCLHAGVTNDSFVLLYFDLFFRRLHLTLGEQLGAEILHDGAEDRVLLQLRFGAEVGPTLGTAEDIAARPGRLETLLAEVVSTGDGDWTLEGAQTDAARQVLFQVQQLGHDVTSAAETKPNSSGKTKVRSWPDIYLSDNKCVRETALILLSRLKNGF